MGRMCLLPPSLPQKKRVDPKLPTAIRVAGIEPALHAWEARVLPLNDTRAYALRSVTLHCLDVKHNCKKNVKNHIRPKKSDPNTQFIYDLRFNSFTIYDLRFTIWKFGEPPARGDAERKRRWWGNHGRALVRKGRGRLMAARTPPMYEVQHARRL